MKLRPYIMIAPVVLLLTATLGAGMISAGMQSLGYFPAAGLDYITFKYYKEVLQSPEFFSSMGFSLYISLVSSIIAVIAAIILSFSLIESKKLRRFFLPVLRIPVIVPHIAATMMMISILSQTGMISRLLYHSGIIGSYESFPSFLYTRNAIGIILVYIWKEIPFVTLAVYAILSRINLSFRDAAANLGANRRQIFFHIYLPLIMPSAISSFILIFAFSFGAYEVPFLLGPSYPRAAAVEAFVRYTDPSLANRPYAMAINMIMITAAFIMTWIYMKLFEKTHNRY